MARILAGKTVVKNLAEQAKEQVAALADRGIVPTLALVRVGARGEDLAYERMALKRAEAFGVRIEQVILDADAPQSRIEEAVRTISNDAHIHGCLIFRPLPEGIDEAAVCAQLAPEKDVDGITLASTAALYADGDAGYPPCTAAGCLEMLDAYTIPVSGRHVVVAGRSLVIGKPVSLMLLRRNATVTIAHSRTGDMPALMRQADIVVCAVGHPRIFGADCFRPGQTVLDVGINFDGAGNMCGDVDFDAVEPIVEAISPVPGGLGPVTTSVLMGHVIAAAKKAAQGN